MQWPSKRINLVRTALAVAVIFTSLIPACNRDLTLPPTGPSPTPSTTTVPPPPPPRVDRPFEWNRGILLFAGARAEEDQIRNLFSYLHTRGIYTAEVCAEVQSWPHGVNGYLPRGVSAKPFDETAPAYRELQNFLNVAATIPNAQVLVVGICNLKEDGTSPQNRLKWTRTIADLLHDYDNVAMKIANEWQHPNSNMTESEVVNLLVEARDRFSGPLTTDDNVHPGNIRYNARIRPYVDIADFHPWRNPEPTNRELDRIVQANGYPIVFSETVAYNSLRIPLDQSCSGLRTCDKNQIISFRDRTEARGIFWYYHCIECLCWPECDITWIP